MKKISVLLAVLVLSVICLVACGKNDEKVINVCASDVPHAEILEGYVKEELKKKGYTLKVTVLDWTQQNDAVANGDYDANYFQHQPYLDTYNGKVKLALACKVHYEPLGIYKGSGKVNDLKDGTTFEICNDVSNGIRAFQLLVNKGVITADEAPYNDAGDEFDFSEGWNASKDKWSNGTVTVTLVEESLLVASKGDYDFACLPCNTAYTGNVTKVDLVTKEDDPNQVANKANGLAVRVEDYKNDAAYKAKIDALVEVLVSAGLSEYFDTKYLGAMTCDNSTQIDLRAAIK